MQLQKLPPTRKKGFFNKVLLSMVAPSENMDAWDLKPLVSAISTFIGLAEAL